MGIETCWRRIECKEIEGRWKTRWNEDEDDDDAASRSSRRF